MGKRLGTRLGTTLGLASSGGGPVLPTPPSGLSYSTNPANYVQDVAITPNTPTVSGVVDSYTVFPALPAGLTLNPVTGVITGTPTVITASAVYTVAAINTGGSTGCNVTIAVLDPIVALAPHTLLRASVGFAAGTWTDIIAARTFSNATPPTVTTAPELNGAAVLRFNGTTQQLVSTLPASAWKIMHDGVGCEVVIVCVPRLASGSARGVLATVSIGNPTTIGYERHLYASPDYSGAYTINGTVRIASSELQRYGHKDQPTVLGSFVKTGSNWRHTVDNFVAAQGALAGAASAADPNFTLTIGGFANNGAKMQVDIAEIMIFDRELTPAERATINSYCVTTYNTYDPTVSRVGANTLTDANHYSTPGGEAGAAGGFGGAALIRIDTLVGGTLRSITNKINAAPLEGWDVRLNNNAVSFSAVDGAAAAVVSPAYTYTAADVGKWDVVVWQSTGAALTLYRARELQGSSTAITGFTPSATPQYIGRRGSAGNHAQGLVIASVATWQGTRTLAEILAIFDATKRNGDLPIAIPGITHHWSVKVAGSAAGNLNDQIGTDNMIVTGAPTTTATAGANEPWCY